MENEDKGANFKFAKNAWKTKAFRPRLQAYRKCEVKFPPDR